MSGDPWMNPEAREWLQRAREELVPKIQNSGVGVSLVPAGKADVKFAVELGLLIMMDKPIIAVVQPGTPVPPKLIAVADQVVEGDIGDADFQERLHEAINATLALRGEKPE